MPNYQSTAIKGRVISGRGAGSFLMGATLGGLQEADNQPSALSGNGLGMGMRLPSSGAGLSSINKKLEGLMVKASKTKPKSIRFNI